MALQHKSQEFHVAAHRIDAHSRIAGVYQLKNFLPFLLDEMNRLPLKLVIGQSPALDLDAFIASAEIAIKTLLLANTGRVDRDDHENSPAIKIRFNLRRTGEDGSI
jgi:hypothetical protein